MNYWLLALAIFLIINWSWMIFVMALPFTYLYCRWRKSGVPPRLRILRFIINNGHFKGYVRYMDIRAGMIPSHHIRKWLYAHVWLVDVDKSATIHYGAEIRDGFKLHIGSGSIIGDKALLDARNTIEIKNNVNISSNVSIYTEQHDHRDPYFNCNSDESYKVQINDRAWIGPNAIILHSVTIGEGG